MESVRIYLQNCKVQSNFFDCWNASYYKAYKDVRQLHVRVIALERWKMTFFFTFSAYILKTMIDGMKLSVAEMIHIIRPAKVCGVKVLGWLLVRVIALEKQKNYVISNFQPISWKM